MIAWAGAQLYCVVTVAFGLHSVRQQRPHCQTQRASVHKSFKTRLQGLLQHSTDVMNESFVSSNTRAAQTKQRVAVVYWSASRRYLVF